MWNENGNVNVLQNVPPCNGGLDATKNVWTVYLGEVKIETVQVAVLIIHVAPQLAAQEPSKWQGLTFAWFWFLRFIVQSLTFAKPLCYSASSFPSPYSKYQFISTEFSFSVAVPDGGCHPHLVAMDTLALNSYPQGPNILLGSSPPFCDTWLEHCQLKALMQILSILISTLPW